MKLLPKIGILAAGIIMSVSFAAGIRGNDAIEVSAAGDLVATFELGANGAAGHKDGSENATYTEEDGKYTLSITGGTKMYTGAIDAIGNSCIKFGTKSAAGSMSFTVPSDVTEVVLRVGNYKENTAKIKVNGTDHTLTQNSDSGAYDAITVNTSSAKAISFTTASGGYRAMLNTIEYYSDPTTAKVLDRISAELITSDKTWYVGDIVTAEDIEVTAHYTSGDPEVITSGYTLSNNELSLGLNTITVEYEEKEDTLEITAIEKPVLGYATITGIAKAAVGGVWDLSDLVVNGTSTTDEDMGDITDKCELSTDASTEVAGNTTITVSVTYEGVTVDVHNVSAKVLNTVEKTDVLTRETTGVAEGTNYDIWEYTSEVTGAKYSGNSAGEHNSIQIRSKNSNSGIITQVSGGLVKSVSIKFNSNTLESRELDIYGSNNPYLIVANIYGTDDTKGDLVHTFTYSSTEQTYDFEADYSYIGIRSKSGALYIDQISITWASYVEDSEEPTASELVGNFVDTYMHMEDYTTNQGLCAGENGYYAIAKKAFHEMTSSYTVDELVEVFETEYNDAYLRYLNWAEANGDASPFDGDSINPIIVNILGLSKDNSDNMLVIFFSILGCLLFGLIALIMRKRFIRK